MSPQAAKILAEVAAAKQTAMHNFERDWGTRDVGAVVNALRQTIPNSTSPRDAAKHARTMIG